MGNELCTRVCLTCEWLTNERDSIILDLVLVNYDIILAGITETPEHDEMIDSTQDYVPPTLLSFVALSTIWTSPWAWWRRRRRRFGPTYVAQSGARLLEFATQEEAVAGVHNGGADAVLDDTDILCPIVDASGGELACVGEPVPIGEGISIGLRESDTELKSQLEEAITFMKEEGTLN